MHVRTLCALAVTAALAVAATPADAGRIATWKESYRVSLPVPLPVSGDVPGYDGCWKGEEGVSKSRRELTLPGSGSLKALVEFTGDWDLYLFDANGAVLAKAETDTSGTVENARESFLWRKGVKGQKVYLVTCNWLGLNDATITFAYSYFR